jgi:hypothetical protein
MRGRLRLQGLVGFFWHLSTFEGEGPAFGRISLSAAERNNSEEPNQHQRRGKHHIFIFFILFSMSDVRVSPQKYPPLFCRSDSKSP